MVVAIPTSIRVGEEPWASMSDVEREVVNDYYAQFGVDLQVTVAIEVRGDRLWAEELCTAGGPAHIVERCPLNPASQRQDAGWWRPDAADELATVCTVERWY